MHAAKFAVFCLIAAPQLQPAEIPVRVLEDKIRGGLLGQILGDLNGLPHEMKYIAEPGNVTEYLPSLPDGAWTDDDTDVEWVYVLEMERSRTLLLSPQRIRELWTAHIRRRIWCSNQYARVLMELGFEPPLTGHSAINPWADFNLSGQFLSETWGLISPGMPQTAARMALHYTRVGVDLEPLQSAQLFSAMIATAFFTSDLEAIVNAGVAALDPKSRMRAVVDDVRRWSRELPHDWRQTRARIHRKYSVASGAMRDRNGVELNGASAVAALLYGRGDFVQTAIHAFNFGWDADNNAAMASTITGLIKGNAWMSAQGWKVKDVFRNTSRDDMPDDETITRFGDRLVRLADQVILEHGGTKTRRGSELVYQIRTERPANVAPLPDAGSEVAGLRSELLPSIEKTIASGKDDKALARSAYLAICLDAGAQIRQRSPAGWDKAVAVLNGHPRMLQAIFYYSDTPAGSTLQQRALAAGLRRPDRKEPLWR